MSDDGILTADSSSSIRWSARDRLSLGSLSVTTFALVFSEFLPAGLLTPVAAGFGISEGLAGQTVTATAVTGAITALLIGLVIGRIDRKSVMLFLCALVVVSNVLAALAPNFAVLIVARLLVGAAIGGFWALAAAIVARIVSLASIGKGMGIIFVGVSLATICAPPLGALIADAVGWRAAFGVSALIGVLAFILDAVTLPRLPASDPLRLRTLAEMAGRPMVLVGLVAVVAIAGGHFAGFTYIRPILESDAQLPATLVAIVLLAFGIANFAGNLAGGAIVDRNLRLGLGGTGVLLGLSALAIWAFGSQPVTAIVCVAIWGFAFGAAPIALQTWMAKAAPDHLEGVGGLFIATFQVSIAVGAAVGGGVVDHFGVIAVLLVTGILGLGAACLPSLPLYSTASGR